MPHFSSRAGDGADRQTMSGIRRAVDRASILVCLMALIAASSASARDYFVAKNGSDAAAGTLDAPFSTIQRAADLMRAGDTCYLREGNYHEEVTIDGLKGTKAAPVTFAPYEGESVTLDGTLPIAELGSRGWTRHSGNIYKTKLQTDIWQVFVDGEWMMLARWPNARFDKGEGWDFTKWATGHPKKSKNGTEYHQPEHGHDLAGSGLDLTGAMAILNVGSFTTEARPIVAHAPGKDHFDYAPTVGNYRTVHHHYFVDSKLCLLDSETEWHFDPKTKYLYLWAPGGGRPSGDIRGKNMTNAFFFRNSSHVTVRGLNFFGTTFRMTKCNHITVENCDLNYPSFNQRVLGKFGEVAGTRIESCTHTKILNCLFAYTDALVMKLMNGNHNTVENCELHHLDYTCAHHVGNSGAIWFRNDPFGVFRRNTLYVSGPSEGVMPSSDTLIELNDISSLAHLQNDGAYTALGQGTQRVILRKNWFHDTLKPSARFSDGPKNVLKPWMKTGMMLDNVTFEAKTSLTFMVKGDERGVYNNLCEAKILFADTSGDPAKSKIHAKSVCINNVTGTEIDFAAPTRTEKNNWEGSLHDKELQSLFRDWGNRDFRPKAGSDLVDAGIAIPGIRERYVGKAPDIGPYEYGDKNYWIPGRRYDKSSKPIPMDGNRFAQVDADLIWMEGREAVSNRIYFGTSPRKLHFKANQTNNIYSPGRLEPGQTYFWRIDTVTKTGVTRGDIWSFTPELPMVTARTLLKPTEDTAVDSFTPKVDLSRSETAYIKSNPPRKDTKKVFMKFFVDLPKTTPIKSAYLRLYSTSGSVAFNVKLRVLSDTSWNSAAMRWQSGMPADDGVVVDKPKTLVGGQHARFDVLDAIRPGWIAFSVEQDGRRPCRIALSEHKSHPPLLRIEHMPVKPGAPAPRAPANLTATRRYGKVHLDWDDNVEGNLGGYRVFRRDGVADRFYLVHSGLLKSSSFTVNLPGGMAEGEYMVRAENAEGALSKASNRVRVSRSDR